MGLIYSTVMHKFRKANKLSCNEYILADMIYHLSTSPESKIIGWCYMGRETMADELGLSKQSILNLLQALITKGFIIKDDETSFLKTTKSWNLVYFTEGKESLPENQESLPKKGKESRPYNNSLNNNIDNELYKEFSFFDSDFKKVWNEFIKMRISMRKKPTPHAEGLILKDISKFSNNNKEYAIKIVNQSILNSWLSVYDLKPDQVPVNTQLSLTGELQPKTGAQL